MLLPASVAVEYETPFGMLLSLLVAYPHQIGGGVGQHTPEGGGGGGMWRPPQGQKMGVGALASVEPPYLFSVSQTGSTKIGIY